MKKRSLWDRVTSAWREFKAPPPPPSAEERAAQEEQQFQDALAQLDTSAKFRVVTFLHTYAGHGARIPPDAVVGELLQSLEPYSIECKIRILQRACRKVPAAITTPALMQWMKGNSAAAVAFHRSTAPAP